LINAVIFGLLAPGVAIAQSYEVLHNFGGTGDGAFPFASLIQGTDGNFYGTTGAGGTNGVGTVFRMNTAGTVTILHSFASQADGIGPKAGLVQGTDGYLYGTTSDRGTLPLGGAGAGTVFKISTDGTSFINLRTFGGFDGEYPLASLIQGTDGDFYGTTLAGGTPLGGDGTVFKITSTGTFTLLHTFTGPDGRNPSAPLIQATDGNFYGTTANGGTAGFNTPTHGTIFKITSTGMFTSLHTFTFPSGFDGREPAAALIQAADGNFYGTTKTGGAGDYGTVFKMDAAGNVTTLHSFASTDGADPLGALIQTADGTFYGTTSEGDSTDFGTVFMMDVAVTVTTAHRFLIAD